jgi:hypothetical protein
MTLIKHSQSLHMQPVTQQGATPKHRNAGKLLSGHITGGLLSTIRVYGWVTGGYGSGDNFSFSASHNNSVTFSTHFVASTKKGGGGT